MFQAQIGMLTSVEAREKCMPLAEKVLELDPFLPEAHADMATGLTWHFFNWEGARAYWEKAHELNPSYAEAHVFFAHYLGILGELDKSTEHIEKAVALDPLNPFTIGLFSVQLVMRNEYEEAISFGEQAVSMAPGYAFGYSTLVMASESRKVNPMTTSVAYEFGGDYESSIDWLEISADRLDRDAPYDESGSRARQRVG